MDIKNLSARAEAAHVIARAARATGADFAVLLKTAARESAFDPSARARTSSAAGMFQFIEQTWLAMVERYGARHGLADAAAQIERGRGGQAMVRDSTIRKQILDLRFNPDLAARLAGEFTQENARYIEGRIGRAPGPGELYAAHFLGPAGAVELIRTAAAAPETPAANVFPAAAAANRPVFFERSGNPRSAADLLAFLARPDPRAEGVEPQPDAASGASLAVAPAQSPPERQMRAAEVLMFEALMDILSSPTGSDAASAERARKAYLRDPLSEQLTRQLIDQLNARAFEQPGDQTPATAAPVLKRPSISSDV